jgi:hypothetical protein
MAEPQAHLGDPTPTEEEVCNLEAVREYVRIGTLSGVSRKLGIPLRNLNQWSRTAWWQDEVVLLRREQAAQLDALLTNLHGRTVEELIDRVENGDLVRTKTGKTVRAPLKARDVAAIAHIVFTERQLLRNEPTAIQGDTSKVQTLAEKLRLLGKTLAQDAEVIDAQETSPAHLSDREQA